MSEPTLDRNEHGTIVTAMNCTTCGKPFTVTGDHTDGGFGTECLSLDCPSYDVERDAGLTFDLEPWRITRAAGIGGGVA